MEVELFPSQLPLRSSARRSERFRPLVIRRARRCWSVVPGRVPPTSPPLPGTPVPDPEPIDPPPVPQPEPEPV